MGQGAGLPAAESGVLTHLPVCAAPPGLITSLLPYQMTRLPFLLPSHAVFLPPGPFLGKDLFCLSSQ